MIRYSGLEEIAGGNKYLTKTVWSPRYGMVTSNCKFSTVCLIKTLKVRGYCDKGSPVIKSCSFRLNLQ